MTPAPEVRSRSPLREVDATVVTAALTSSFLTAANLETFTLEASDLNANIGDGSDNCIQLKSLHVRVSSLAGGATALVIQMYEDASGDEPIFSQSSNTLTNAWTGLTTATKAQVTLQLNNVLKRPSNGILYLNVRTNAGTATFDGAELVYEPN
jgi:hypothetical protein